MSFSRIAPSLFLVYALTFAGGFPLGPPPPALDWELVRVRVAPLIPEGFSLDSAMRGTADLNGDRAPDSFFVIRHSDGVTARLAWVSRLGNQWGWADLPSGATIRGLESTRGEAVVRMATLDSDDLPCCPTFEQVTHYAVVQGKLQPVGTLGVDTQLPPLSVHANEHALRVDPPSGAPFGIDGIVIAPKTAEFLVDVPSGHRLNARLDSSFDDVALESLGPAGETLNRSKGRRTHAIDVHSNEQHLLRVTPMGGGNIRYRLTVQSVPLDQVPSIHLTFDDGPDPRYTPAILDLLDRYGAKATFFWIGQTIRRHPDLVRDAVRRGHRVANHTYGHTSIATGNAGDIAAGRAAVNEIAGDGATRCLRPPYGKVTTRTHTMAASMGEVVTMWTTDTRDWTKPGVDKIVANGLEGLRSGSVILMHDGGGERTQTIAALSRLLAEYSARGFRMTALVCQ